MNISPFQDHEPLSEINMTPFVDVLLVLLIIFMITAPIVHHVIQVDLPEETYNRDKINLLQDPLRVVIDQAGLVYIGDEHIGNLQSPENGAIFQKKIQEWAKTQKDPFVDIEADKNVIYGEIIPVIARLKEMNIGLNLVITPKTK